MRSAWWRVANQRVTRSLWAAFLRGGGGVLQRLLPYGMTWGVIPFYYNPLATFKLPL